ncbi:hypothetical protein [Paraburkholderia sp. DGU8]|jgi:hypothetical protein|uniref:hypothetical protein n=1 Tax=Paraburkholderia sp. DGU8 TaxID=3161997 RepID=UPI003465731A
MMCSLFTEEVVDTRTTNGRLRYRHRYDQGKPILLRACRGAINAACLRVAFYAPGRASELPQSDLTGSLTSGESGSVDKWH